MLDVCLLGTGGMMPLPDRWLTSLIMRHNGSNMMIDCGEGTQITMKMLGWSYKAVDYICFTHFHADHISGLPGLLFAIGNAGRTEPMTLVGPLGLQRIAEGLLLIANDLPYEIKYIELDTTKNHNIQLGDYDITCYGVAHTAPCFGYTIDIHRLPKFIQEKAEELELPKMYWGTLQKGEEVQYEGKTYTPDMVLGEERKGIRVSYSTDTRPTRNIVENVKGADLFICEGMYGDPEMAQKAKEKRHMSFYEAAKMAKDANVGELWLTHFSPALINPKQYQNDVREIFKNTKVGRDRLTKTIKFVD